MGSDCFTNPEGSHFRQSRRATFPKCIKNHFKRVSIAPVRKSIETKNLEGSRFCQFRRVEETPVRSGPEIITLEVPISPIRKGHNPEGSQKRKSGRSQNGNSRISRFHQYGKYPIWKNLRNAKLDNSQFASPEKSYLINQEESQPRKTSKTTIQIDRIFAKPKQSFLKRISKKSTQKYYDFKISEFFQFRQPGRLQILPTWHGPNFANLEGSLLERISKTSTRKGYEFKISEWFWHRQYGRVCENDNWEWFPFLGVRMRLKNASSETSQNGHPRVYRFRQSGKLPIR